MASEAAKALPLDSGSHSSMNNAISLDAVFDMGRSLAEIESGVNDCKPSSAAVAHSSLRCQSG